MAEKKIKDRTVRYERLPGDQGLDMLLRLLQILGDGDTLVEALLTSEDSAMDAMAIVGVLKFAKNMNRGEVKAFILDMVKACKIDGMDAIPWLMEVPELLAVAQFAVKTEFSGFFEDGAGSALLKGLRAAA